MKLEDWRNEIDSIEAEILRLINQRTSVWVKIGVLKATAELPIMDIDRAEAILRGVCGKNSGVVENESLVRIFRQIIRESKQIQTQIISQQLTFAEFDAMMRGLQSAPIETRLHAS